MRRFNFLSCSTGAIVGLMVSIVAGCGAEPSSPADVPNSVGKTMVVAADGTGDFKTLQEAIEAVPDNRPERTVIRLKSGTYRGPFVVPRFKTNVTFQGEDPARTILTYDKNAQEPRPKGAHIFNPGLDVLGNDFHAEKLTIQNTSGDHGQALAARVAGERFVFENCRLLGWQDTLLLDRGHYYFKHCYLEGRVDFIYGEGAGLFEGCEIHSKNGGFVTAASTKAAVPYGFVFLNCRLTGDSNPWPDPTGGRPPADSRAAVPTNLGRPWGPYASVTLINCEVGDHIRSEGWNNWGNVENEKTARYSEFNSHTPGGQPVDVSLRAPWSKQLSPAEAADITPEKVLDGWNPRT